MEPSPNASSRWFSSCLTDQPFAEIVQGGTPGYPSGFTRRAVLVVLGTNQSEECASASHLDPPRRCRRGNGLKETLGIGYFRRATSLRCSPRRLTVYRVVSILP